MAKYVNNLVTLVGVNIAIGKSKNRFDCFDLFMIKWRNAIIFGFATIGVYKFQISS